MSFIIQVCSRFVFYSRVYYKFQGVLLGLSNTAGVLAGVFGTAATGYILQRGENALLTFYLTFFFSVDILIHLHAIYCRFLE